MLDRLKAIAEAVRGVLLWIVAPLAILGGYVFYLLNKNRQLQNEISIQKMDSDLDKLRSEEGKADAASSQASSDFESLASEYEREHGSGVPAGNSSGQNGASGKGSAD
jgi:hypothetical protein